MERTPVLVIGLGNLLWADEGFGVRCVESLHARYELPEGVRVLDGGTQGLYLVPHVCGAERLLVLDAVDFGNEPGTLRLLRGAAVPRLALQGKMSMHQTGFQDVLAAVELLGHAPRDVVLIGVQPQELEDFGGTLTQVVSERVGDAVLVALAQLTAWGFRPRVRTRPAEALLGPCLDRASWETLRPSAAAACRLGDARFFPNGGS